MKIYTKTILLVLIVAVSLFLRTYRLGDYLSILNRDEAAIAYNAFLLEQTGQDEWGSTWPLTLQSFGDYKLIGYPSLVVGFFKIFGYADWVVRLPSALAGVGVLLCIYFLSKRFTQSEVAAVSTTILAATTPIFFFYSRIAFEANVGLLYVLVLLFLLLRKIDKKTLYWDGLAVGVSILGVITYNTPLLLLPFITLSIPLIRGITNYRNWLVPVLGLALVFLTFFMQFAELNAQKQAITVFSDPTTYDGYVQYRSQFSGWQVTLLGNQYLYFLQIIFRHFLSSFSYHFLVAQGGAHPWHSIPGWSHILLPQYILGIAGLIVLLVRITRVKLRVIGNIKSLRTVFLEYRQKPLVETGLGRASILTYLTLVSLVPSVITVDSPHATRSLLFIVLFIICGGYCIAYLQKNFKFFKWVVILAVVSNGILFSFFVRSYFTEYPSVVKIILKSGYDQTIQTVETQYQNRNIAVIDPDGYQYVLTAWYLRMPPTEFFSSAVKQNPDRIGFRYGEQVGRYHFVKEAADRSQEEQVIVEWSSAAQEWQVREGL